MGGGNEQQTDTDAGRRYAGTCLRRHPCTPIPYSNPFLYSASQADHIQDGFRGGTHASPMRHLQRLQRLLLIEEATMEADVKRCA